MFHSWASLASEFLGKSTNDGDAAAVDVLLKLSLTFFFN